jgi:WS/DGAT/MGAT family acyltransferase
MDAVFLAMETPETPAHVGGLAILDPTSAPDFGFARFLDFLESRLAVCPRFMWTVQEVPLGLDRPYWVERNGVSPRDLVHRIAVPSPGGTRELGDLAGLLFARPLDRSLPLWEMYFIEGLQGGRVALLWKVHHCLLDGASGAGLAELLFDLQPEPGERPLVAVDDDAHAGPPASLLDMLGGAVRNGLQRPVAGGRHVGRAVRQAVDGLIGDGATPGAALAPRTIFNGTIGRRRAVAWSSVPLEDAKAVKNALRVKLNDVVLAVTGGAVRRYLIEHDALPEASLVASVPVSTRREGDRQLGNQLSEVNVYWGTDIEDPIERVRAVHRAASAAKEDVRAGRSLDIVGILAETLVPGAVQLLMRTASGATEAMPLPANAVVSNVPMTPVPLYIAGARVAETVPISLLAPTQGLNITVLSYDGSLHFGITADPGLVEEPWLLAGLIQKSLLALQEAVAGAEKLGA